MFEEMAQALKNDHPVALVAILESHGSVPRGAGALMAVYADGHTRGTIGGGAVEHAACQMAQQALQERRCFTHRFSLSAGEAAGLGMVCGGNLLAWCAYVPPGPAHAALFEAAAAQAGQPQNWLVFCTGPEDAWQAAVVGGPGRDILCQTGVLSLNGTHLEEITLETAVFRQEKDHWQLGISLSPAGRTFIFGAGHVAQQLVPVLQNLGFSCIVVDDRAEFANRSLFPHAHEVRTLDFAHALGGETLTEQDFVVIMTRGHQHDYTLLRQVLHTGAGYIGMIGSQTKVDTTFTRLIAQDGFACTDIRRVHAPIGLPIGSETPQEIAISIAAQMVAFKNRK